MTFHELPLRDSTLTKEQQGLFAKYHVSRVDGSDEPGQRNHGHQYFVLDLHKLATDAHAKAAIAAYIESAEEDYPLLATDLRGYLHQVVDGEFITVPETILPNGLVVPSVRVAKYLASGVTDGTPMVDIDYLSARTAAIRSGGNLITETQWLAIAHNIAQQPINWTGGAVGAGKLYQGLHKGTVSEVQPAAYESPNPEERRWHELSNGERIYDFAGHCYSWVFDDVQGDDDGLIAKAFAADSPSLTTAPAPSMKQGVGWIPDAGADWSGDARCRGGCWCSGDNAGVFSLNGGWPRYEYVYVGFRCTKSL